MPLLRNPQAADGAFTTAYGAYHGTRFNLAQRIIWQRDWKFVFNGFDFDELYNLKDDPHETKIWSTNRNIEHALRQ